MQELYNFLSGSTSRWAIPLESLNESGVSHVLVITNSSHTRWSARYDALRALSQNYEFIELALKRIGDDEKFDRQSRFTAYNLAMHVEYLKTGLMTIIWSTVLERFQANSLTMQKLAIDLSTVVSCYHSLIAFIEDLRLLLDRFEARAMRLLGVSEAGYVEGNLGRRRYSSVADLESPRDKFTAEVDQNSK